MTKSTQQDLRKDGTSLRLVRLPAKKERISIFFSIYPPALSCPKYVMRIHEYTQISPGVFMRAVYILHELRTQDARFELSGYNLHRLLMTAVVLAIKFHEHAWHSNKYYAQVGGIPSVEELNKMELMMLDILEYRLHVQPKILQDFFFAAANEDSDGSEEKNKYMVYLMNNARQLKIDSVDDDVNIEEST